MVEMLILEPKLLAGVVEYPLVGLAWWRGEELGWL
jgi:hypothetical protein